MKHYFALFFSSRRTVILFAVRYNFKNLVVWRNFQRAVAEKTLGIGINNAEHRILC